MKLIASLGMFCLLWTLPGAMQSAAAAEDTTGGTAVNPAETKVKQTAPLGTSVEPKTKQTAPLGTLSPADKAASPVDKTADKPADTSADKAPEKRGDKYSERYSDTRTDLPLPKSSTRPADTPPAKAPAAPADKSGAASGEKPAPSSRVVLPDDKAQTVVGMDKPTVPGEKYQQMLATSRELKEADQAIKDTLAEARRLLTPAECREIEKIQASWAKNDFTRNVKAYMTEGMSEAEAWAMEIGSHVDILGKAVEVLHLRRTGTGPEGVYEYVHGAGKARMHGMLMVKKVDDSYTVNIEVTAGTPGAINVSDGAVCIFIGEGVLKGDTLVAATEDAPESSVSVIFGGKAAQVKGSAEANLQCGKGVTLNGSYVK